MNNERDFKGVWIPKAIYVHEGLTWTEKILLVEIDSLDKGQGCWASNGYFADFLGISEGSVANSITKLRKMGLIIDISFDGRKRYIGIAELIKKVRQSNRKYEGRVHKNMNDLDSDTPKNTIPVTQKGDGVVLNNTSNNTERDTFANANENFRIVKEDKEGKEKKSKQKDPIEPLFNKCVALMAKDADFEILVPRWEMKSVKRALASLKEEKHVITLVEDLIANYTAYKTGYSLSKMLSASNINKYISENL